jgi:hypothetical protein
MNRNEKIYLALACIFTLSGFLSLLTILIDPQNSFIYGTLSMWLLIPGGVLFLAAFQSKIKISENDHGSGA